MDSVEQILSKSPCVNLRLQVLIGRTHQTNINFAFALIPDPRKCAVLQKMEQLALEVQIQIRNFIEEERASFSKLHSPWLAEVRAGEGPSFESEQLTFQQGSRNGGAVNFNKFAFAILRIGVDPSRRLLPFQFLPHQSIRPEYWYG